MGFLSLLDLAQCFSCSMRHSDPLCVRALVCGCVCVCCTWVEESASYIQCRRYGWHRLDKWFQLKCKDCRSCYHSVHVTSTNIALNILPYGHSDAILATACAGCIFSWICSRLTIQAKVTMVRILLCDFVYVQMQSYVQCASHNIVTVRSSKHF